VHQTFRFGVDYNQAVQADHANLEIPAAASNDRIAAMGETGEASRTPARENSFATDRSIDADP